MAEKLIKNKTFIAGVIIFCVSLTGLFWFGSEPNIGAADSFVHIDLLAYFKKSTASWVSLYHAGMQNNSQMNFFPAGLIYFPLGLLGFSNAFIQRVWIVLSLFFSSFFFYLFIDKFLGKKTGFIHKITGSIFYVYNPAYLANPTPMHLSIISIQLSLPVFSYLVVALLRAKEIRPKILYLALLVLSTTLISSAFANIPYVFVVLIVLFILIILELLQNMKSLKINIIFTFSSLILMVLLNFWWIYGSFYSFFMLRARYVSLVSVFKPRPSSVFDTFRLMGQWSLYAPVGRAFYYPFGSEFYSSGLVFMTYVAPIIVYLPLLLLFFSKKAESTKKSYIYVFIFMSLLGVFLAKSSSGPYGDWFDNLYDSYAIFRMFRNAYLKFILLAVFSYSVSLVLSLGLIEKLISKNKQAIYILYIFVLMCIIGASYPYITGEVITSFYYNSLKSQRVEVPSYWHELSDYTSSIPYKGRIFLTPYVGYYQKSYLWPSGYSGEPALLFINHDYITGVGKGETHSSYLINHLYDIVKEYNQTKDPTKISEFIKVSQVLNISYFLQMNDFDWLSFGESYEQYSPEIMESFYNDLADLGYIRKVKEFGNFSSEYLGQIPYLTNSTDVIRYPEDPQIDDYVSVLKGRPALIFYELSDDFKTDKVTVSNNLGTVSKKEDDVIVIDHFLENSDKPLQSIKRLSNTRYVIEFDAITPDEVLVFKENFRDDWVLAYSCGFLKCDYLSEESYEHFIFNTYANGWKIKDILTVNKLYIQQKSEFRLRIGIIVSIFTLIGLLLVLFMRKKLSLVIKRNFNVR